MKTWERKSSLSAASPCSKSRGTHPIYRAGEGFMGKKNENGRVKRQKVVGGKPRGRRGLAKHCRKISKDKKKKTTNKSW